MYKKIVLIIWSVAFAVVAFSATETVTLVNGTSFSGEIVKFDDIGMMVRLPDETYTNVSWVKMSQDTLRELRSNPKIRSIVEPFIEPDPAQLPQKTAINISSVERLNRPQPGSSFGGMLKSPLGIFMILIVYLGNLFAAREIGIVRARPIWMVIGLAAVVPIVPQIVFLILPVNQEKPKEKVHAEASPIAMNAGHQEQEQVSEGTDEIPANAQVFVRGKFTFNRKFIETKFAAFVAGNKQQASNSFAMQMKTTNDHFKVVAIAQIAPDSLVLDTVDHGTVTVVLSEIQEIILIPINQ